MKKLFAILALAAMATSSNAQIKGDMNDDGVLSLTDIMFIVDVILGKELSCPDNKHPHMIDLGLPSGTKWACCNVDDTRSKQRPENYGSYYAWGEVKSKDYYSQDTYEYYKDGKYVIIGSEIAGTNYDVAHVKWGGSWVMPTKGQFEELRANCTWKWITQNGVNGVLFKGANGGSIFLPAAGYRANDVPYNADLYGYYWSSTIYPNSQKNAAQFFFSSISAYLFYVYFHLGLPVRPVSK